MNSAGHMDILIMRKVMCIMLTNKHMHHMGFNSYLYFSKNLHWTSSDRWKYEQCDSQPGGEGRLAKCSLATKGSCNVKHIVALFLQFLKVLVPGFI